MMVHRGMALKVDVVPCGPLEVSPGSLALRGSVRRLTSIGLSKCFAIARPLMPSLTEGLVPLADGYVVLKLFAYGDRRARHPLRDLGHVLRRDHTTMMRPGETRRASIGSMM